MRGEKGQEKIVFTYKDGTTNEIGPGSSTANPVFEFKVCGNFIGLRCNFQQKSDLKVDKLGCCEIYDDLPVN